MERVVSGCLQRETSRESDIEADLVEFENMTPSYCELSREQRCDVRAFDGGVGTTRCRVGGMNRWCGCVLRTNRNGRSWLYQDCLD